MEERGAVGKDKKFVLYTVVGDERRKTSAGIWAVRIILGTLLIVALAVVPYVSLRMAQVSDRTLVVFQPVLVTNHSKSKHTTSHNSLSAMRSVHNSNILQSASFTKENISGTLPPEKIISKNFSNGTILTLHETAVTFSLLDDVDNETKDMNFTREKGKEEITDDLSNHTSNDMSTITNIKYGLESSSTVDDKLISQIIVTTSKATNMEQNTSDSSSTQHFTSSPSEISKEDVLTFSGEGTSIFASFLESTSKTLPKLIKPVPSQVSFQPAAHKVMTHKLAYVATASSGNHIGGVCIWKTNKNITKWSYFFDNIPMEYQSKQDTTDREMTGLLVAVRLWASKWTDYHVILRSQSNAIEGSTHDTRKVLLSEIEDKSEDQFTYELEWRLRKDDSLVAVAYSLARLYKDFTYWSNEFEQRLETVVGNQEDDISKMRVAVPQEIFITIPVESQIQTGDLNSLNTSGN